MPRAQWQMQRWRPFSPTVLVRLLCMSFPLMPVADAEPTNLLKCQRCYKLEHYGVVVPVAVPPEQLHAALQVHF